MNQGVGDRPRVDQDKVRQIRQLKAQGGDRAVERRFGEDVGNTPEAKAAEKQRNAVRRRQQAAARGVSPTARAKAAAARPKPQERGLSR